MSEIAVWRQMNAMKKRLGGWSDSPRQKMKMEKIGTCPGWMGDPNPRRKLVFERRQGHGPVVYRLYWRLHPEFISRHDRRKI